MNLELKKVGYFLVKFVKKEILKKILFTSPFAKYKSIHSLINQIPVLMEIMISNKMETIKIIVLLYTMKDFTIPIILPNQSE